MKTALKKANAGIAKAMAGKKAAAARKAVAAKAKSKVKAIDANHLPHGAAIARLEAKADPKPAPPPEPKPKAEAPVAEAKPAIGNGKKEKNGGLAVVTHAGQIKTALKKVERAIQKNSTLPVLSYVMAEAVGEDKVKFTATNLNLALWTQIDAHVNTPGAICLPPILEDLIAQMDDEHLVTLTTNEHATITTLRVGRRTTRLAVLLATEFPAIAGFNGQSDAVTIGMTHDQLKSIVKQVLPFTSGDDSRPVLTGIYLSGKVPDVSGQPVEFQVASADGFRLAHDVYKMPITFKFKPKAEEFTVIVPADAWKELDKFIGPDDGKLIQLAFHVKQTKDSEAEPGMLQVETEQGNGLRMNLLEGNFPNYHEVMKEASEYAIIPMPAKAVALAAKGAALLVKKGDGIMRIYCDVASQQVRLESKSLDIGEFSESVPVDFRPEHEPVEGFSIAFNVGLFAEMLHAADHDSDETVVELRVSKNSSPGFIHVGSYTHVLMPMKSEGKEGVEALNKKGNGKTNGNGHKVVETPVVEAELMPAPPAPPKPEFDLKAVEAGSAVALEMVEEKIADARGDLGVAFSNYAGDALVPVRQALMKVLTGQEKPKSLCGVHALEAAYVNYRKAHPQPAKAESKPNGQNGKGKNGKSDTKEVALVASYGGVSLGKIGTVKVSPHVTVVGPHAKAIAAMVTKRLAKSSGKAKASKTPARKAAKVLRAKAKRR